MDVGIAVASLPNNQPQWHPRAARILILRWIIPQSLVAAMVSGFGGMVDFVRLANRWERTQLRKLVFRLEPVRKQFEMGGMVARGDSLVDPKEMECVSIGGGWTWKRISWFVLSWWLLKKKKESKCIPVSLRSRHDFVFFLKKIRFGIAVLIIYLRMHKESTHN